MKTTRKIIALNIVFFMLLIMVPYKAAAAISGMNFPFGYGDYGEYSGVKANITDSGAMIGSRKITVSETGDYIFRVQAKHGMLNKDWLKLTDVSSNLVNLFFNTANTYYEYRCSLTAGAEYTLEWGAGKTAASYGGSITLWTEKTYKTPFRATILTNNSSCGTAGSKTPDVQGVLTAGETVALTAVPKSGYVFSHWFIESDGVKINNPNSANTTFNMPSEDVLIWANFAPVSGAGNVSVSTENSSQGTVRTSGSSSFPGALASIYATPKSGYAFDKWVVESGNVKISDSNSAYTTFTVESTDDVSIKALFKTTGSGGSGGSGDSGGVSVVSENSSQGTVSTTGSLSPGSVVTIKATPKSGYVFNYWLVSPGSVYIVDVNSAVTSFIVPQSGNVSVKAVFKLASSGSSSVTVSTNNSTQGTVSVGSTSASPGSSVSLYASAYSGYVFDYWEVLSGNVTIADIYSASTSFTVLSSGNISIRAVFKLASGTGNISVSSSNSAQGTVSVGSSNASPGSVVSLYASAYSGYVFDYWEVLSGNVTIADIYSASTTFTVVSSGNISIRAVFKAAVTEVYLENGIKAITISGLNRYPANGSFKIAGVTYTNGLCGTGTGYSGTNGTAVYNINGQQFTRLTGIFGVSNASYSSNTYGTLTVTGDGVSLGEYQIQPNEVSIQVDIYIPFGIKEIRIVIKSGGGIYGFANAFFERDSQSSALSYNIIVTAGVGGSVSGGGTYQANTSVTLNAAPDNGYTFDGWYEANVRVSTNALFTFIITAGRSLEARFTKLPDSEPVLNKHSPWAEEELQRAKDSDLIPESLTDSSIDYTRPITRAEFAGIAVKIYENLTNTKVSPAESNPFTDTGSVDVLKAYNADLMVGVSADKFDPNAYINREQAAATLTRIFKKATMPGWTLASDADYPVYYTSPEPFADDADISNWAKDSVYFMASNGIIKGVGSNKFAPRATTSAEEAALYATLTREQALVMALRMAENMG